MTLLDAYLFLGAALLVALLLTTVVVAYARAESVEP